ncbi:hypothetical protein EVAR_51727_1 [Eumeta japonica]|uniref:Uncharacterized protein n=1 Tax=Eumeta variegata TaxID=151549 RepID=A0A4C1XKN3_EUMVA|nr:hypothetical protein EVAR_51727_1 [Eumeta japonica]
MADNARNYMGRIVFYNSRSNDSITLHHHWKVLPHRTILGHRTAVRRVALLKIKLSRRGGGGFGKHFITFKPGAEPAAARRRAASRPTTCGCI